MGKAIVRKFNNSDFDEVALMSQKLGLLHGKSKYINGKWLRRLNAKSDLRDYLKKYKASIFVAVKDDTIVGYVLLRIKKAEPWMIYKKYVYLDEIFVKKEYRRSGIAESLLYQTKKFAKSRKLDFIQARIWTFNKTMRDFLINRRGEQIFSEYVLSAK